MKLGDLVTEQVSFKNSKASHMFAFCKQYCEQASIDLKLD